MPIKKDGTGTRWIEMEFVTPGTPEQVWQAMATGPGNEAWFTKATIEERVGGAMHFDFGSAGSSTGEVTKWEPPHRFGYIEREWSPGAPPVATEITITSRSGDKCIVRMVHSLFSSADDWDDQLEGFESGWPSFFEMLRIYLAHFPGQKATLVRHMVDVEGTELDAWKRLTQSLDLASANVGEHWTTPQPQKLSGVIERVQQDDKYRFITLRLDGPAPGAGIVGTSTVGNSANVSLMFYFYGEEADKAGAASNDMWRTWLEDTFAGATPTKM